MPTHYLRAIDVREGQAVIQFDDPKGRIIPPRILVRGNFDDQIPTIFNGKIPFAQIGIYGENGAEFSPIPMDVKHLDENQGLDVLVVSYGITAGEEENPLHFAP